MSPRAGWLADAASPSLDERRALLVPGLERRASLLHDLTAPQGAEAEAVIASLLPGATGAAPPPQRPAQALRDRHVQRARSGRRWALLLAAGVLAVAVVGPMSRESQALEPGARTQLDLRTLHTTGAGIVVAGRGELTLDERDGGPVLVLHEGHIEVAARGDEALTVQVGPHRVQLEGGRLRVERLRGEVRVVAEEGVARWSGPAGEGALRPGEPAWAPPPPEAVETCGGEPEADPPVGGAPDPAAGPAAGPHAAAASAIGADGGPPSTPLRLGAPPAELGVGGRQTLAALEAARAARGQDPPLMASRPGAAVGLGPIPGRRIVPTVGGGAATGGPSGLPASAPLGATPGASVAASGGAVAGVGALPHATVAHATTHGVEGAPPDWGSHHDSGLGVCLIPASPPPPELALAPSRPSAPTPAPRAAPRPRPVAVGAGPPPEAAPPARRLPLPPGLPAGPATAAPDATAAATRAAVDRVLFGAGLEVLECEP